MKDGLGRAAVERLADALDDADFEFARKRFIDDVMRGLDELELKARVNHIIAVLTKHLPDDTAGALAVVERAGAVMPPGDPDDPLRGFAAWPLIDWIGVHGLEDPDRALPVLRALTGLFTAEFAIRPFIAQHRRKTMTALRKWSRDPDEQVRRLVSEGTRPRLPWAGRLPEFQRDPKSVLALLERLKGDDSEYVRRSVANNLNDISKDHPDLVVDVAARWIAEGCNERMVKHALRSVIKQGHPGAMVALGFSTKARVDAELTVTPKRLRLGNDLRMKIRLTSTSSKPQKLVVDYAVHFRRKGDKTGRKVFKLRTLTLEPGASLDIDKRHPIVPITTRRYYPGEHRVELLVAGAPKAEAGFRLVIPKE